MEMPCGSVKDPSLSLSLQRILGQFKPREKSRNSVCVSEKKKKDEMIPEMSGTEENNINI